jgi:hypothetical protein
MRNRWLISSLAVLALWAAFPHAQTAAIAPAVDANRKSGLDLYKRFTASAAKARERQVIAVGAGPPLP